MKAPEPAQKAKKAPGLDYDALTDLIAGLEFVRDHAGSLSVDGSYEGELHAAAMTALDAMIARVEALRVDAARAETLQPPEEAP